MVINLTTRFLAPAALLSVLMALQPGGYSERGFGRFQGHERLQPESPNFSVGSAEVVCRRL
jgi:hypothetical protein